MVVVHFINRSYQKLPFGSGDYRDISAPRYIYWSTIDNSSSPHFRLTVTATLPFDSYGYTLSLLHTTTYCALFLLRLSLHFPRKCTLLISHSLFISAILLVFLISRRNHPQTSIPTPYLPPPSLAPLLLRLLLSCL